MAFTLPNTIVNDTTRDARPIQANFNAIESALNGDFLLADGTVALTAPLSCASAPSSATHLTNKAYVDASIIPVGVILPYGGATTPSADWAFCQGQLISQNDYPDLYTLFGSTYGTPTGSQFYLPDLRDRVPVGKGTSFATTLGAKAGSKDAVVVTHRHGYSYKYRSTTAAVAGGSTYGYHPDLTTVNTNTDFEGVSGTDKNLQPYIVLNYIVRLG